MSVSSPVAGVTPGFVRVIVGVIVGSNPDGVIVGLGVSGVG